MGNKIISQEGNIIAYFWVVGMLWEGLEGLLWIINSKIENGFKLGIVADQVRELNRNIRQHEDLPPG